MAETAVVIPINVLDNNATTKIGDVQGSLKKLNDEVKKGSSIAQDAARSSASLSQSFVGLATRIAGPVALLAAFYKTIKTGLSETIEIEKATKLLSSQFQALGVTNKAVTDDIIKFTTALAEQTAQDQSTLINVTRLISSFGVYGEALKEATVATLDIAAAMGVDQETAARAVGKAIQGSGDALKRYGITVKEAITPTENLANLMEALRQKGFSGAAAADVNTFAGALRNLLETFKSFSEALVNTKLFGLISLRDIFKDIVENLSISMKAVGNFISTGSTGGGANMSIKERDAKKEILSINTKLNTQASNIAKKKKEELDATKRQKEIESDRADLFAEVNSAIDDTRSKEELINDLYFERVSKVKELLNLNEINNEEAQSALDAFQKAQQFNLKALQDAENLKNRQAAQQRQRDILSAVQGGDATNIIGTAGGTQVAAGAAVFAMYLKLPQIIQQIGESITDLFTDWVDGWKDIGSLIDGSLEVFAGRANALAGSVENFEERMKKLDQSIEDAAMSARSSSENLKVYNARVAEGRKGIRAITREFDALLVDRTVRGGDLAGQRARFGITEGDIIRVHRRSRREFNRMFDELEKGIEEQIQLVQQQHSLRMQQLNEELSLWQNVREGFDNAKKTISGALLSPEQSSAAALETFRKATGADKAQAALDLQNALLNEFQAAQQAAASGLITQEELKNRQSSLLAILETASAEAKTREDKLLMLAERENKIFLSQLDELKNIRKILEGTKSFQEGGQVNKTGFAFVHEGENVIPKGATTGNVNIVINGKSMGTGTDIVGMLQEALKTNRGGIRDTLKRLI